MASHVVVVDTTARSTKIRTVPDKQLTEVLEEACQKLGRDSSKFTFKYKSKNIDLSRTIRLAGLLSGARLELVASSRSPSVVSVALQLPETEKDGTSRLTDKFPSDATLWMILRKFESTVSPDRNYTGRGIPVVAGQNSGAGRLYFETPVIQIMGRELHSFTDLQKTLSQLGFNSGSTLLRLSFRKTETPLEEAITQIRQCFSDVEEDTPKANPAEDQRIAKISTNQSGAAPEKVGQVIAASDENVKAPLSPNGTPFQQPTEPAKEPQTITGPSQRPIAVFAPPTSSTPQAAQQPFDERDYEPTIDHAKLHQQRLKIGGQNKRLPTDAELAAQAEAQAQKTAQIKEVKIKVRFPDQSQVEAPFSNVDTAQTLYQHVRDLMQRPDEPYSLTFSTAKGPKQISRESDARLISDLGMVGRVLVTFVWDVGASAASRALPALKPEFRQQAQRIQIKQIEGQEVVEGQQPKQDPKPVGKEGKERKGVPKWLKLPGKK